MYIEYTPQGFNIIGLSPEMLEKILRSLKLCAALSEPDAPLNRLLKQMEQEQQKELRTKS
jgi:hypothetical protein